MNRILTRSHTYKIRALNIVARWIGGCVYCGGHVQACDFSARLCVSCALKITGRASQQHRCHTCAAPLETAENQCLECINQAPLFQHTHAFSDYNGLMQHLIVRYKFNSMLPYAPLLADIIGHTFKHLPHQPNTIIAVPQHETLTRSRGFLPLQHVLQHVDWQHMTTHSITVLNHAVIRLHQTQLQARSNKEERQKQIKNAFAITMDLTGLDVLLVDDVYTTGATLHELSKVCHQAGAKSITNLVLCRARLVK